MGTAHLASTNRVGNAHPTTLPNSVGDAHPTFLTENRIVEGTESKRTGKNSGAFRAYKWTLLVVILAGTLVRAGLIAKDFGPIDDPDNYLPLAKSLWNGEGFCINGRPTAYRPPLFPILLVPLVAALPEHLALGIALLQVGLGALTILATAKTARRWTHSTMAALMSAAIVAFDPVLVSQSRPVMTETLAAALAAVSLLAFTIRGPSGVILGGLGFGLSALCRPSVWPAVGLSVIAVLLVGNGSRQERLRCATLILAACLLMVAPWGIRNTIVFGRPILTTTHGGYTLFLANNPVYYREVLNGPDGTVWTGHNQWIWWDSVNRDTKGMSEPEADRFARRAALRVIADQPVDFARASLARLGRFWGLAPAGAVYPRQLRIASMIWTLPLWIGLALGLFRRDAWRWPRVVAPCLMVGLSFVHTFFWTDLRMRASIDPQSP